MAQKLGRPLKDNTKNVNIGFRLSQETANKLRECSELMNTSRTAIIEKGIELVYQSIKK